MHRCPRGIDTDMEQPPATRIEQSTLAIDKYKVLMLGRITPAARQEERKRRQVVKSAKPGQLQFGQRP